FEGPEEKDGAGTEVESSEANGGIRRVRGNRRCVVEAGAYRPTRAERRTVLPAFCAAAVDGDAERAARSNDGGVEPEHGNYRGAPLDASGSAQAGCVAVHDADFVGDGIGDRSADQRTRRDRTASGQRGRAHTAAVGIGGRAD